MSNSGLNCSTILCQTFPFPLSSGHTSLAFVLQLMKTTLLNENKSHQKYKSWDATGVKICDLPTSHWTHGDHQVDFKKLYWIIMLRLPYWGLCAFLRLLTRFTEIANLRYSLTQLYPHWRNGGSRLNHDFLQHIPTSDKPPLGRWMELK